MAIVVSLIADSLAELEAAARRQEPLADLLELRLDRIRRPSEADLARVIRGLKKRVIVTIHGAEAFGDFAGDVDERLETLRTAARAGAAFVDVDWRLSLELGEVAGKCHRIVSRHETQGTPADLAGLLAEVEAVLYEGDVVKLVTHARTCEDGWRVLRLLRERGKGLVAFASGEAGSFTRYLAPILGSPFTYAAPALFVDAPAQPPTAPGQVRVNDLLAVAPPGGLGPETAVFGVLGNPARHSWSPRLFGMALKGARLDALYLPFEAEDVDAFLDLADDENLRGLSVTAPFKGGALARAAASDELTRRVGATNTLVRDGAGWRALNTDVDALRETLERGFLAHEQRTGAVRGPRGARARGGRGRRGARGGRSGARAGRAELVVAARRDAAARERGGLRRRRRRVGRPRAHAVRRARALHAGGFARATRRAALRGGGAASRRGGRRRGLPAAAHAAAARGGRARRHGGARRRVVRAPGAPAVPALHPPGARRGADAGHVRAAPARGRRGRRGMSADAERVALVGLRGAGKSSVGRALAARLCWPFLDLDERLALLGRMQALPGGAGELLAELGEAAFRDLETRALAEVLDEPGPLVLATGGGAVCRAENRARLAERCRCVWLDAPAEVLLERTRRDATPRPALTDLAPLDEVRRLAAEREAWYAELAELRVDVARDEIDTIARVILAHLRR
ncbi:MAG: type I 3-dehydroquinate dehydratase [Planctomycetes bacterium]|nr:type I 3-dehydroquinate dehydratase [Planctomycetota bacterium]